jgi:hypothetical protein
MKALLVFGCGWAVITGSSGGEFRNLGFDEANTNNVTVGGYPYVGTGSVADLLPEWQLYRDNQQLSQTEFMFGDPLDLSLVAVFGRSLRDFYIPFESDGPYALYYQGYYPVEAFRLEQQGQVPAEHRYLTLREGYDSLPFRMSINGTGLPLVSQGGARGGGYQFTYDVSAYAGQTVTLTLTSPPFDAFGRGSHDYLDSLAFTSQVPEPTPLVLLGVGGSLLALLLAQRSRHSQSWRRSPP